MQVLLRLNWLSDLSGLDQVANNIYLGGTHNIKLHQNDMVNGQYPAHRKSVGFIPRQKS